MRGGRNTAPNFVNPVGVDLASATINGDTVTAPTAPAIILPAWAPTATVPPATALDFAPYYVGGGGARWAGSPTPPTTGTWLTLNRGQWAGTPGATWEFRWLRGGVPITGAEAQTYQVQAGDIGTVLTPQARGINASGTGEWASYSTISPA